MNTRIKLIILFSSLCVIIALVVFSRGKDNTPPTKKSKIEIKDENRTVTINEDGSVAYKSGDKVSYEKWNEERINKIFQLIDEKIKKSGTTQETGDYTIVFTSDGTSQAVNLNFNDEVTNEIFQNNASNNNQNTISNYYNFNSTPPVGGSGQGQGGGGGGEGQSSGSNPASPVPRWVADCPFWVLSWCFYPPSPVPIPSSKQSASIPPSPLVSPNPSVRPASSALIPDCDLWGNLITRKAVISQTVCVKKE